MPACSSGRLDRARRVGRCAYSERCVAIARVPKAWCNRPESVADILRAARTLGTVDSVLLGTWRTEGAGGEIITSTFHSDNTRTDRSAAVTAERFWFQVRPLMPLPSNSVAVNSRTVLCLVEDVAHRSSTGTVSPPVLDATFICKNATLTVSSTTSEAVLRFGSTWMARSAP